MSRILLTWELGLNLGHLTRLLPVAERLKSEGHAVLIAARDVQAAATVLGPAGIPFVQAPHLPKGIPLDHRASGYADILLSQGWSDPAALWGLTHSWLCLLRMFRPDRVILDYSPTVSLALRIEKIPAVLVGNGFELPPATDPLPPFPGFSWATAAKAAEAETRALTTAHAVLSRFGGAPLTALRDLVANAARLFATFPELDHYGERADALYIGPLLGRLKAAPRVEWPPEGGAPKVFTCLRPDTSNVQAILSALGAVDARIVCVASGFTPAQLQPFARRNMRFSLAPVDLDPLLDADLCITYGAEGTMMRFLMAGVPQLISPWHVETYMAARGIEASGLGGRFAERCSPESAADLIASHCSDRAMRERAKEFSRRSSDRHTDACTACVSHGRPNTSGPTDAGKPGFRTRDEDDVPWSRSGVLDPCVT